MAKNSYGFISKRYPQPIKYDLIFCFWNAIYRGRDGKEYMIEAVPSCLCTAKLDADIDHYEVIRRDEDCRRQLAWGIKSQKQAIEIISKYCDL